MHTATNTDQVHATTTSTARTTPSGFLRRTMAGTHMATALTASAVGFAHSSSTYLFY